MDHRAIAVFTTAIVGGLVAAQAPINARLGKEIGSFPAATISFATGLLLLATIAFVAGGGFSKLGDASIPWYYFVGGLLGAAYVTTVLVTVRTLGAGGVTAATITGQLTTAVIIDHFGVLGLTKHPITATRMAGVLLLGIGMYLIVAD
ncbi:MAG TPA: DMT family transporter [Solirubrobacterales bacterium]|jgi:transporter family-2 protein|nr:DMT family transporter [Solirubrobacterales bacterium]